MTEVFKPDPQATNVLNTITGVTEVEAWIRGEAAALPKNPDIYPGDYLVGLFKHLQEQLSPDLVKTFFTAFHGADMSSTELVNSLLSTVDDRKKYIAPFGYMDRLLDGIVGIDYTKTETQLVAQRTQVKDRYPQESLWLSGSSSIWSNYAVLRTAIQALRLGPEDTFYDLGSGYGRAVLYAGMVTTAHCRGVEILPERIAIARQAAAHLSLDNVDFTEGNARETDYSDGTAFYMYAPFSYRTRDAVMERLQDIASRHTIRVFYFGEAISHLNLTWLQRKEHPGSQLMSSLQLFESVTS